MCAPIMLNGSQVTYWLHRTNKHSMNYKSDVEAVDALAQSYRDLSTEIGKVIVGQKEVVKAVIISLLSNGHCLLVGVPGLAKTLLVSTIAEVLDLDFKRIQFTPDLMPSDITGSEILDEDRHFKFMKVHYLRISFWRMRLTVHLQKLKRPY